jgi:hypothetical protein
VSAARSAPRHRQPKPRLRLRSYGTARVVKFGFYTGYPGGGSTDSSAYGPRSVESPEFVTGGGYPDVGVTWGQAFDRVWDGVREQDFIEGVNGRSHDEGLGGLWDGLRHDQIKGYFITTSQIPTTTQAIALSPRRRI